MDQQDTTGIRVFLPAAALDKPALAVEHECDSFTLSEEEGLSLYRGGDLIKNYPAWSFVGFAY